MRGLASGAAALCLVAAAVAAQETSPADGTAVEDVERFADGDRARGEKLYLRYCQGCHGVDGRGGAQTFMPHVGNLTKKD